MPRGDSKKTGTKKKAADSRYIPTGSTLFNCALSDHPFGGFVKGKVVNIIGDSHAGKTMLSKTILAEVCHNPVFKDYELYYDEPENADEFDDEKLFGHILRKRVQRPNENGSSTTIRDFQNNILNILTAEIPFIYIVDSWDALITDEEAEKAEARRKGKIVAGMRGQEKAKIAYEIMRLIVGKLKKTNSLLIVISQSRMDSTGVSFIKIKGRSGGDALNYYSSYVVWLTMGAKIKDKKRKDRVIGINTKVKTTKNKMTGKYREAAFPVFYDYGIDDISSCVDFLCDEKVWSFKTKVKIEAHNLDLTGSRDDLILQIEEQGLEKKLQQIVGDTWNDIEESIKINRKPKYK